MKSKLGIRSVLSNTKNVSIHTNTTLLFYKAFRINLNEDSKSTKNQVEMKLNFLSFQILDLHFCNKGNI